MEIYLLKSSAALTILYSIYWFLLRNETYFVWNRIYLILTLLISLISPLINLTIFDKASASIGYLIQPVIASTQNVIIREHNSFSILSIIYISGAVFFSLKFLSKLSQIYYLYFRFQKVQYNGFRTVLVDGNTSPFTFFSVLFMSRSDFEKGNIAEMVVHEKAHKEQFHSFDVILLEITTIVQWFNPFLWLIRMALKAEHEFFADEKVLKEGFDKATYQNLLFEKSLGVTELGVANNFNYSLLKNRLKMMTIKKSGSLARAKYFISLPILLTVCIFFTTNINSIAQEKVYTEVDVTPVYPGGENGLRDFIAQNMKYPEVAAKLGIQGRVFVQFVVSDKGVVKDVQVLKTVVKETDKTGKIVDTDYKAGLDPKKDEAIKSLENEATRVIKSLGKFTPGKKDNKDVSVSFTLPLTFILH